MRKTVIIGMFLAPLWAGAALAETTAPSTADAAKTTSKPVAAVTHSPELIECSKQADAKGLHGKPRKEFRATCKKELKQKKS